MLARVMGGNSGWDIVFPTDYIVEPMLANASARADSSRELAQSCAARAAIPAPDWDPELKWSVPYMVSRRRDRLQPQAGSAAAKMGGSVGRSGCAAV